MKTISFILALLFIIIVPSKSIATSDTIDVKLLNASVRLGEKSSKISECYNDLLNIYKLNENCNERLVLSNIMKHLLYIHTVCSYEQELLSINIFILGNLKLGYLELGIKRWKESINKINKSNEAIRIYYGYVINNAGLHLIDIAKEHIKGSILILEKCIKDSQKTLTNGPSVKR